MSTQNQQTLTLENLASAVNELQNQLRNAHAQIAQQQNTINENQQKLNHATQLLSARNQHAAMTNPAGHLTISPQVNKPPSYKGKGSVLSWATHMSNYLSTVEEDKALPIAVSYLSEGAHEWWIIF